MRVPEQRTDQEPESRQGPQPANAAGGGQGPPGPTDRRQHLAPGDGRQAAPPAARTSGRRSVPFFRFLGFYVLLVAAFGALVTFVPAVRDALVAPGVLETDTRGGNILTDAPPADAGMAGGLPGMRRRALAMVLICLGALSLALPVAWVYTYTRRLRYDPSLVHSVIILPLVVAGIVVIVKDSIALAFSLAGIVAAVRFRNTLKDPKDAVYIFLALGLGLAAGVRALDVALIVTLVFNLVVLVLWKFDLGAIYSGDLGRDILSVGDPGLLVARTGAERDALRARFTHEADGMETDGILLVHAHEPESARQGVELSLSRVAKEWKFVEAFRRRGDIATFAALLRLDKKGDPVTLLAELDERWSAYVSAAEYVPFNKPEEDEK